MNRILKCLVPLLLSARLSAADLDLLRIVVVDQSGSMRGPPLDTVAEQLRRLIKHDPPTTARPVVLLTFGDEAQRVGKFIEPGPLAQWISGELTLELGGGTRIAAGLAAAAQAVVEHPGQRMALLLYSDFQDGDTAGISAELAKLRRLLGDRGRKELPSLVFVHEWTRESQTVREQLTQEPGVLAVNEAVLEGLDYWIQAQASVVRAERDEARPDLLTIEVSLSATIPSRRDEWPTPEVVAQLDAPPVAKTFAADGQDVTLRIEHKLTPDEEQQGTLRLPLRVVLGPTPAGSHWSKAAPLVRPAEPTLDVRVPAYERHYDLRIEWTFPQPPLWADPLALRARFEAHVTFDVAAEAGRDEASTWSITGEASTQVAGGRQTVRLDRAGQFSLVVPFECTGRATQDRQNPLEFRANFLVQPIRVPPGVRWDPPVLRSSLQLGSPAPVVTSVIVRAGAAESTWKLAPEITETTGALQVECGGLVPPGNYLALAPSRSAAQLQRVALQSGQNSVAWRASEASQGAPHRVSAPLTIAGPPHPAVQLAIPESVAFECPAAPPLELVAQINNRLPPYRDLLVGPAGSQRVVLAARFVGLPIDRTDPKYLVAWQLVPGAQHGHVACGQSAQVELTLPAAAAPSYFRDRRVVYRVGLAPADRHPLVKSARCDVPLVREAPFKRLVLRIGLALALTGVPGCVVFGWWKLRAVSAVDSYESDEDRGPLSESVLERPTPGLHPKRRLTSGVL